MDSLEVVEAVILIEEVFGVDIPSYDAESFRGPIEITDWLERHLSNQRPNKAAAALLRKLAERRCDPALAADLDKTWRREQIAAIVRGIFR
jgi:hypothetical protein